MKKFLIPTILIVLSLILFFVYINPTYTDIQEIRLEGEDNSGLLSQGEELKDVRDDLLEEYNSFNVSDIDRLNKLLPDNVDNIRLLIEIDGVANKHGTTLRDVSFNDPSTNEASTINASLGQGSSVGEISLTFVVVSDYRDFVNFVRDLEKSMRLVDIKSIDFSTTDEGLSEYRVELSTYWLKSNRRI